MSFMQANLLTLSDGWIISISIFAIVCLAGLISGFLYRAGAMIMLSFATFVAAVALSLNQGWGFANSAIFAFGLLVGLQVSYFVGVGVAVVFSRARTKAHSSEVIDSETKQDAAG